MSETNLQIVTSNSTGGGTTLRLPMLVDAVLHVTQVIVMVTAISVALLSVLAGAPALVVLLRTGVTVLVVGILGWLFNWLLGRYLVEATLEEWKNVLPGNDETPEPFFPGEEQGLQI